MVSAGRKLGRSYLCEVREQQNTEIAFLSHVKFLRSAKDHHSARVPAVSVMHHDKYRTILLASQLRTARMSRAELEENTSHGLRMLSHFAPLSHPRQQSVS